MRKIISLTLLVLMFSIYSHAQGDDCSTALNLGTLPVPNACDGSAAEGVGTNVTNALTNIGAIAENPYNSILDCNGTLVDQATPAADVWVTFVASSQVLDITITGGLNGANIGLYQGTVCGALTPVHCDVSNTGTLNSSYNAMVPGQQYFMQISGQNELDQSNFSLTLNNSENCAQCAQNVSLTATPPPVNGIYQPGTTVTFCASIESFTEVSVHWIHGVSPLNLGPGWDMSTLVPSGTVSPTNTTWIWTVAPGFQAGWYVDSDNDGSVDDNYGDASMDANMTACWDITTVSSGACVNGVSAGLDVETYSDGESGSYTSGACTGDPVVSFNAIVSCCDFPLTSFVNPSCDNINDGSTSATGQGGTAPYDYSWENAAGTIVQTDNNLANGVPSTANGIGNGTYTVTVTDDNGCVKIVDITITGPFCPPCIFTGITANVNIVCPSPTYTTTGSLSFANQPTTGTMTVSDCNGNQQVFNAPFVSPIAYNITGQTADGGNCSITAVFSADAACTINTAYVAPICPCNINNFNVLIGTCNTATDSYQMTGTIDFESAPTTGTLIVSVNNGTTTYDTIINAADFVSPLSFSIPGIPADGTGSTISATFSANAGCTSAIPYTAPAGCACNADIGTFNSNMTGSGNTDYVLCWGDVFNYNSNNDFTPPDDVNNITVPYDPGITYLLYSCPPTPGLTPDTNPITGDPCVEGIITLPAGSTSYSDNNDLFYINAFPAGTFTNNTIYYVPITMYNVTQGFYSVAVDPCFEMGPAIAVQYLSEIKTIETEDCQAGSVSSVVSGGLPELDGSNYTVVPGSLTPANAVFDNTTANLNSAIVISGLTNGQAFSYNITDGNGCPVTVVGVFVGTEDPTFTYNNFSMCQTDTDPVVNITGDAGTFSSVATSGGPNLSINAATGTVDVSASDPGVYDITYTTNDVVCFSTLTLSMTILETPMINPVTNQTVCDGDMFVLVNFTGTPLATFDWVNTNTTIGLTATGADDISAFLSTNSTAAQVSATITVTPTLGTCVGTPINFDFIVDPLDDPAFTYPAYTYCTTDTDPSATPTLGGGTYTFTVQSGGPTLVLNAASGAIDLSASNPGVYDITYTTAGICPQTSVQTMNVAATPTVTTVTDQTVCDGEAFTDVIFIGAAGTSFDWVNTNPIIGLAAMGNGDVLSFVGTNSTAAQISGTITVTPSAGTCIGTPINFDFIVNPLDDPAYTYPAYTYCTTDVDPSASPTLAGGTYTFTVQTGGPNLMLNAASGAIDLSASNPGVYDITYTTAGTCPQTSVQTMNVAATPTVTAVTDQTVCDGVAFTDVIFIGAAGTSFDWVNTNTTIGLAAMGNGDVLGFVGTNSTAAQTSGTITVTPSAGTCVGTPINFDFIVDPLDDPAFTYPTYTYCTTDVDPSATPILAGGTYTFTVQSGGPNLVLNAATGTIDLSASDPGVYDITYTTAGTCPQTSVQTMNVAATPTVTAVTDQTVCDGVAFTDVIFIGAAGTSFDWVNTNTTIGLAAMGNGDILGFVGANGTAAQISGTITVTPSAGTCVGTPINFDFIVDPLDDPAFTYPVASYCSSETDPVATANTPGGTYSFVATNGGPNLSINTMTGLIDLDVSNPGTYDVTYTTAGNCSQSSVFSISVAATPAVNPIVDQTICHNDQFVLIDFNGSAGSIFNWTNNTASIGLTAAGVDDIQLFTGLNAGTNPVTATITVTPVAGSCVGVQEQFLLTVNPLDNPGFNFPITSYCTTDVNPTPTIDVVGGTFTTFTTIGTGVIDVDPSTGLINLANSNPGTYDVTYTTVGPDCPLDSTISIVINITPTVNPVIDQLECENGQFATINFIGTGNPTFTWSNDNTNIGLGANGIGDILPFPVSSSGVFEVANLTVTPSTLTCIGLPEVFILSVNPQENPGFVYGQPAYCTTDIDPSAVIDIAGGIFTTVATVGGPTLVINASTGLIDLSASDEGVYDVTYTTAGPCFEDSTVSVIVNFTPTVDPIIGQTVCDGDDFNPINFTGTSSVLPTVYDWTNSAPSIGLAAAGNGNVSLFTASNTAITQVTGVITVTPSTSECIGTPTSFNLIIDPLDDPSFIYNDGLTYCATGGINPVTTITGAVGGAFTFVINSGGPTLVLNPLTGGVDLAASDVGSYDIKYLTNGVCPQSSILTLVITNAPIADFTIGIYCADDVDPLPTYINSGSGGAFTSTAGIVINSATGEVDLSASTAGTYTITNTIDLTAQGCALANANDDITINELPTATISGTASVCQSSPLPDVQIDLTNVANGPFDVTYSFNGTNTTVNSTNPLIIPNAAVGDYQLVSVADVNGCTNSANGNAIIDFYPNPIVNLQPNQEICEASDLLVNSFTGMPVGNTYNWILTSGSDIGFGVLGGGDIGSFTAQTPQTVTIEVLPTSINGCVGNSESFNIDVNPLPVVNFSAPETEGCVPFTASFTSLATNSLKCFWDFGDGSTEQGCGTVSHIYTEAGIFDVTLTVLSPDSCVSVLTMPGYIIVTEMPVAGFTYTPEITDVSHTEIEFTNSSTDADYYEWEFGDETALSNDVDPTHLYPDVPEQYYITLLVTNNNGICRDSIGAYVTINDILLYYVPNVFTPDQDEYNETFKPVFTSGYDVFDYHLIIFNRWGETIFESYDASVGWDGTYPQDAELCEDGVYIWKIDFKETMSDKRHDITGHVSLLK